MGSRGEEVGSTGLGGGGGRVSKMGLWVKLDCSGFDFRGGSLEHSRPGPTHSPHDRGAPNSIQSGDLIHLAMAQLTFSYLFDKCLQKLGKGCKNEVRMTLEKPCVGLALERLVFYCRTASLGTAPCASRIMKNPNRIDLHLQHSQTIALLAST